MEDSNDAMIMKLSEGSVFHHLEIKSTFDLLSIGHEFSNEFILSLLKCLIENASHLPGKPLYDLACDTTKTLRACNQL